MQIQARTTTDGNPFANSQRVFDRLTSRLSSPEVLQMTHADLERLLEKDGREVLRQLFQDHLDLRGPGCATTDVISAGGIPRPHARLRERALKTLFGSVQVSRMGYSAHDETTLFPKDAELNLPPQLYSHGVERRVADEVAKVSFDQSVTALAANTGVNVPKRQMEELAARAATDFDEFYAARAADSRRHAATTGSILALSTDGKGIVMRPEDLREATRRAAAVGTHKLTKRLSPGEKRSRKRMAQVAAVYTIAPFVRQAEDIVRDLGPVRDSATLPKRPRAEHKRVWASVEKSPNEVIDTMFEEALRRDPRGDKQWVALVDGNLTQLSLIKAAAKRRVVPITIVVDIIHVLEYLWGAGMSLHGEGEPATQRWVSEHLLEILRGNSSQVAAGMRRSATLRGMKPKDRAAVDKCADYLLKYRRYLRYDQFLAAGLPISTGVIEGACRHLVKDRMDITGACWGLQGAEAVLKLRALRSSGDADTYWPFHEHAQYTRNHLDLYAGAPPTTALPLNLKRRAHLSLVR
jgi:hypothetical protein